MSQVPRPGGTWLKAKDIMAGERAEILTEAKWEQSDYNGQVNNQYVCMVKHKGEEKKLKITMASCEFMALLGEDSTEWIGKEVVLTPIDVMVGGKVKQSILTKPVEVPAASAQPEQPIDPNTGQPVPWDE
jgi:hypothetical protein